MLESIGFVDSEEITVWTVDIFGVRLLFFDIVRHL